MFDILDRPAFVTVTVCVFGVLLSWLFSVRRSKFPRQSIKVRRGPGMLLDIFAAIKMHCLAMLL